jgi:hypothetical protein
MRRLALFLALPLAAQQPVQFEGRPGTLLSNGKLDLIVLLQGATFASLLLREDADRFNPMWEPIRMAREAGSTQTVGPALGHFVCVDGFGPVSAEERAAGLEGHGEAHRQQFKVVATSRSDKGAAVTLRATLPVAQEVLTRTVEMTDGENVVAVSSEVESLLGFDRPMVWAEHATIGSPFLAPGVTVVDLSAGRCQTRFHAARRGGGVPYRLPDAKNFTWPLAPTVDGGTIDLRAAPATPMQDHTTCVMDPNRKHAWVTALHLEKLLLIGYLWERDEFPWLQNWLHYPPNGKLARGLEFSTQPYDVPRRQAITLATMFDAPTYRWLPAKAKATAKFLMFYARAPEGMRKVDDVTLEAGAIAIEDRAAGRRLTLATSATLP